MSARRGAGLTLACVMCVMCVMCVACASDRTTEQTSAQVPRALTALAGAPSPFARGADTWELWLCDIPQDTTADEYTPTGGTADPWRAADDVNELAAKLDQRLGDWTRAWSNGLYEVAVRAGGRVGAGTDDGGHECVERVLAARSSSHPADGVLVVATAAHRPGVAGGWGRPGTCTSPCRRDPVDVTGRAVYVGASDLHPSWGEAALDLVEHELGHALDLPHSHSPGGDEYSSDVDVMSDPAAPRTVDEGSRDGGRTIAANLIALGWIPLSDVAVVDDVAQVELASSSAADGLRAAVIALDDARLVVVERREPDALDVHLTRGGFVVNLIDQSDEACAPDPPPCTGEHRDQTLVAGRAAEPLVAGDTTVVEGWRIEVVDPATVALTPPDTADFSSDSAHASSPTMTGRTR